MTGFRRANRAIAGTGKWSLLCLVTVFVGCGPSPPRQRDAVPFARQFVLTVFPHTVSCATVNSLVRAGNDGACNDINSMPDYYMTSPNPTAVHKCNGQLRDGTVVPEQCVEFNVIARAPGTASGWTEGALSLGVGKDRHGHLVEDGIGFEGGDCFGTASHCRQLWNNRVTP